MESIIISEQRALKKIGKITPKKIKNKDTNIVESSVKRFKI